MNTWHAHIGWSSTEQVSEETAFDLMGDLTAYAPCGSIARDGESGSLSVAVDTATFDEALAATIQAVRAALGKHAPTAEITSVTLMDAEALDRENAEPLYPEVVGWSEIAEMAGVTRSRARQFRIIPGFPAPVIETAQGPLMAKAAVEQWVATRNTRSGRPRKA